MAEVLISEARVRDVSGKVLYVQPPGTPHVPDHAYFSEQLHRGKTFCPCCEAKVVFRTATPSVAGSSFRGRKAHFALPPNGKHDEGCDILSRPHDERHLVPNRSKGFRIHINTRVYSDAFNDVAVVYARDKKGRIQIVDPDLRDRERYVVHGADDLVRLFKMADPKRVADSKIIFRNRAIPMEDFFIRQGFDNNVTRFERLLERLEEANKGEELFCAMVIPIDQGKALGFGRNTAEGRMLNIGWREGSDMPETIVPEVYARNRDTTHITWAFTQPGTYLVMGVPRLNTNDGHTRRFHHISIALDDPAAIAPINMREILKSNRRYVDASKSAPSAP